MFIRIFVSCGFDCDNTRVVNKRYKRQLLTVTLNVTKEICNSYPRPYLNLVGVSISQINKWRFVIPILIST